MQFFAEFFANAQDYAIMVLGVLFIFTLVVFIHELGHFLVARWAGVRVKAFSIGFGPEIGGFTDKSGTRWRFAWLPLGGYVKFIDDDNAASVPSAGGAQAARGIPAHETFQGQSVGKRAAIVAAGPIANFLLAIVIFAGMYSLIGEPRTSPRVDKVLPGSAAAEAGIKPGDLIIAIDGRKIETFAELQQRVMTNAERPLKVVLIRDGKQLTLVATPKRKVTTDRFGNEYEIGLLGIQRSTRPEDREFKRYDPLTALQKGVERTWFVISHTLNYIAGVIIGSERADQLGGPVKIAQIAGQAASVSFAFLLQIGALISISLGLINLFPIPVLDGGHLLFYAIEAIRGQPLSERTQEIGFRIGLALILMLMVVVTWKDVVELASK